MDAAQGQGAGPAPGHRLRSQAWQVTAAWHARRSLLCVSFDCSSWDCRARAQVPNRMHGAERVRVCMRNANALLMLPVLFLHLWGGWQ